MRLRYGGCSSGPARGRLTTARWIEELLPQEGALLPVATALTSDGILVVLHVRARGGRQAVASAA